MNRQQLCICFAILVTAANVRADDWPQWLGAKRDGVWREDGIVAKFPAGGPTVRWRMSIGSGYSGPAVARGRVYLMDRIVVGGQKVKKASDGSERVLCLDEATGKILWKHEYDCSYFVAYPAGPRVTPVVHGGKVYALGTMGNLLCLEADTGNLIWSHNLREEYDAPVQNWGFSAHPLLDGERLICMVGGKGAVVAFHKDTGKEVWRALPGAPAGYCPPMIYTVGDTRQLIVWNPQAVNGLEPVTGKVHWSVPFKVNNGISIATPRLAGDKLFVSCFYNGPLMLQLDPHKPAARVFWKGASNSEQPRLTDKLHCLMSTPVIQDGHIYGVCSYGHLRCLRADTGERLWETLKPTTGGEEVRWGNAFLIPHRDRFFLFNEMGELILAKLTPKGYEEISRASILAPTNKAAGRPVVWSHPAFANRSMFARNDREIVCVSLATTTE